ncbi:hypothetical protein GQ464_014020 [Rhodocaloribacter litoris]|uniref:hypothetical protein n=1 Tax=Rhodocaloribacter litoris TaxID=2558931 RepID=UPI001423070F|nr:hypothetical protein [Rhodocaloribacter litoris]QXD14537.1 hypothetical protein GQ464_014020 [Rhodocaloribacter litoris]
MFELKPIRRESIPAALEKARHYRLLNEPMQAESICLDILEVEPGHQDALITLLLALTDQFERTLSEPFQRACALLPRLKDPYHRAYYDGLICERRAKAHLRQGTPGAGHLAYAWFRQAMERYEAAEPLSPEGNDDAILRWNTCARIIMRHPEVRPEPEYPRPAMLE